MDIESKESNLTTREFGRHGSLDIIPEWSNLDPQEILKDDENNPNKDLFGSSWEMAKAYTSSFSKLSDEDLRQKYQFQGLMRFAKVDDESRRKFLEKFEDSQIEESTEKATNNEENLNTQEMQIAKAVVEEDREDIESTIKVVINRDQSGEYRNRNLSEEEVEFMILSLRRLEAIRDMDNVLNLKTSNVEYDINDDPVTQITTFSSQSLKYMIKFFEKGLIRDTNDFRYLTSAIAARDLATRAKDSNIKIIRNRSQSPKNTLEALTKRMKETPQPASTA